MKRYIMATAVLLALCIVKTEKAVAQRCMPGMKSVELRGGFIDGIRKNYYAGIGMAVYTKYANMWRIGAEYLSKRYIYEDTFIPKAQFTVEGGYNWNILSDPSKTFFLYAGGSAFIGYETSNWGKKTLYDGATLRDKDCFIYGGILSINLESYFSDCIVFMINVRERIFWGSTIGKFHTQLGVGLKFIIN